MAEQLDGLEAENLGDARGDEGNRQIGIGFPDPIRGEARDVFQTVLGDREIVPCLDQVADLAERAGDRRQGAGAVVDAGVMGAQMQRGRAVDLDVPEHRLTRRLELGDDLGQRHQQSGQAPDALGAGLLAELLGQAMIGRIGVEEVAGEIGHVEGRHFGKRRRQEIGGLRFRRLGAGRRRARRGEDGAVGSLAAT